MEEVQENILTTGNIRTTLLKFALPFLGAGILQALYGAVDLYVVGHYCDSATVSAVSIGSQVMQTITGIILGIATGGTVMIARYIGAKDEKGAAHSVGNIIILFLLIAAILTPIFLISVNGLVDIMKTPSEAVSLARNYVFICSAGIPCIVGYNAVSAIFRGFGNSKTPLLFVVIACIFNIFCDFLFVGGFDMGASGAALATIISQTISFVLALVYIRIKGLPIEFTKKDMRINKRIMRGILIVGVPIAIQDALVNVSFLVITVIMNTLGLIASAAVGVAERLLGFAFLVPASFAQAVAAMAAQNIGAGKEERGWKTLWCGIEYSLIFGVITVAVTNIMPETLTSIFSKDEPVIIAAGQYIRSYAIDCVLVSFIFSVNSYFSAYEHSMYSFIHSMIATFVFRIPATYIMSKLAGDSLYIIGYAAPIASIVSIIICTFLLASMRKKVHRIYM